MRMRYDPESGALYIRVREGEIEETLDLPSPGSYVDVDADGAVVGLEFLSIQEFVMFLTGFGGEVELPEQLDVEVYEAVLEAAFRQGYESRAADDSAQFFRDLFHGRADRERTRGR